MHQRLGLEDRAFVERLLQRIGGQVAAQRGRRSQPTIRRENTSMTNATYTNNPRVDLAPLPPCDQCSRHLRLEEGIDEVVADSASINFVRFCWAKRVVIARV